jgi:hypothetical protein
MYLSEEPDRTFYANAHRTFLRRTGNAFDCDSFTSQEALFFFILVRALFLTRVIAETVFLRKGLVAE